MGSLVEFIVKIKDMASAPVATLARNAETSFNRMASGISRVSSNMNRLRMSISDIDRKLNDLRRTREISLDSRQIRRINREITDLERRRQRLENPTSGGFSGMRGLVAGAMAMAGIAGLSGVVGAGMERSMTNTRFEVLAGKKEGGQLSGNLNSFAQKTIYGNEVFGAAQTMMGFGIEAKNVMPSIKMLGDIAMGNKERFGSLALAFSQSRAAGRLMGQDVLQFVNAGFNPLQEISKMTGQSMLVLKKRMEDGKIPFTEVAKALEHATGKGGAFYDMTRKIGETTPGKLIALQGSIQGLTARVGVSMLDMLSPLITFTQWIVDTPVALNSLAAGIAALVVGIGIFSIVTNWAAISAWLLNIALMWPVLLIAVLIAAIVAVVTYYEGWGKAMQALWAVIKAWTSNVGIAFKDFFQEVGYKAELFWLKIKQTFQFIGGAIGNLMNALKLALQFKFGEAKQALFAEIKTKASAEIETLEKNRKAQRSQNMVDFANNLQTISKNSKLIKLTERKGSKSADEIGGFAGGLAGSAGIPDSAKSTNNDITSGGTKTVNISIGKFQDQTVINNTGGSFSDSIAEIEDKLGEMFLRITNSGANILN